MLVSERGTVIGRIPLDDMAGLICNAHALSYSNNLLVALAERGCPVVLCGKQHSPVAIIWPTDSHHVQGHRLDLQIRMTVPRRKQLWQQLVQSKLSMQADALDVCGRSGAPLRMMVRKVSSGDSSNIEGQGARVYWSLLFGSDFRRDVDADGINGLLNYGYAILRSCVARHLMGCGLHPGIGLHHSNDANSFRLVDDVMEPFRPLVDILVWTLTEAGLVEVDAGTKKILGLLPTRSVVTKRGISPVTVVVQRLCESMVNALRSGKAKLELPHQHKDPLKYFLSVSSPGDSDSDATEA